MTPVEFMNTLAPGDTVTSIVYAGGWNSFRIVNRFTVARLTATQMVLQDEKGRESRYRLKDGRKVGDGFESFPLPAEEDEIRKVDAETRARNIAARLDALHWSKVPLDTLEKVWQVLSESKGGAS